VTTSFIDEEMFDLHIRGALAQLEHLAVAAVLQYDHAYTLSARHAVSLPQDLRNWSSAGALTTHYRYKIADDEVDIAVSPNGATSYVATHGERQIAVELLEDPSCDDGAAAVEVMLGNRRLRAVVRVVDDACIHLTIDGQTMTLRNLLASARESAESGGGGSIAAPMHGVLVEIDVAAGDTVVRGDRVAVLEAMKMQHEISAEVDGKVREVFRAVGDQVAADDLILEIEEADGGPR